MDAGQVKSWLAYHCRLFPDFADWWRGLAEHARTAIRDEWLKILRHATEADAEEVSRLMLSGTHEHPRRFDYNLLASRVAAHVRELAFAREPKPQNVSYRRADLGQGPTAGEIYVAACKARDDGMDVSEVLRSMIPARDDTTGKAFRCRKCCDSGLVSVWSNRSLAFAMRGEIPDRNRRSTMLVACDCAAGNDKCLGDDERSPTNWHGWRESARYAPDRYCRCERDDIDTDEKLDELLEWAKDYRQPARVAQFDEWNNA